MKYESYYKSYLEYINESLEAALPKEKQNPKIIHKAMRYAMFPSGKRFRPLLTLISCEACGARKEEAILPAMAIELIHAYSLVHDDLPALDNDNQRRGKPTCHVQFGEAIAVLAGDGLLTHAFSILSRGTSAEKARLWVDEISTASGTYGMIGGQVADLECEEKDLTLPMQDYISSHKTGKLIKTSAVCGAIAAEASEDVQMRMQRCGEFLGLAFQSVDDLLDGDGYTSFMKPREIHLKVRDLIANAKREIKPLGKKAEKIQALADYLLDRLPGRTHVAVD